MISFACPHCKNPFGAQPQHAGKIVTCPHCRKPVGMPVIFTAPVAVAAGRPESIAETAVKQKCLPSFPSTGRPAPRGSFSRRLKAGCGKVLLMGSLVLSIPWAAVYNLPIAVVLLACLLAVCFRRAGWYWLLLRSALLLLLCFLLAVPLLALPALPGIPVRATGVLILAVFLGLAGLLAGLFLLIHAGWSGETARTKQRTEV